MELTFEIIESNDPDDFKSKVQAFYQGKIFASLLLESSVERSGTGRLYWMHISYALVTPAPAAPDTFGGV